MFARVYSAVVSGPTVQPVTVEVVGSNTSLPTVSIIGLANTSVLESKDRVFTALRSLNLELPRKRIVISLRPVDLPKSGSSLDLAIALGVLMVQGILPNLPLGAVGELGLDGALYGGPEYPALLSQLDTRPPVYAPLMTDFQVQSKKPVRQSAHLRHIYQDVAGSACLLPIQVSKSQKCLKDKQPEFFGQKINPNLLTALSLALVGGHHLLLFGSPGSGKTHSRNLLQQLLLPESDAERYDRQLRGGLWGGLAEERIVSPHHSASVVGLVGGGQPVRPGVISRAHQGFLFMDELPEFPRPCLEALRQPLESESITIVRGSGSWTLPCSFTMVATANPCLCGYYGEDNCQCTPKEIDRYLDRISGPILDRIDLQVRVVGGKNKFYSAKQIKTIWNNIVIARQRQKSREKEGFPPFSRQYSKQHLQALGHDFIAPLETKLMRHWSIRRRLKYWRVVQSLRDMDGKNLSSHFSTAFLLVRPTIGPGQS